MDLNPLLALDAEAIMPDRLATRHRDCHARLVATVGRPFIGLVGPRGVGKTVLFRQLRAAMPQSIYISADSLEPDLRFAEIARALASGYGIRNFFIDEIHFLRDFGRELKELHDFTELHVWFTSSMSLALEEGSWDLSRRASLFQLLPFSYGEYLRFARDLSLPELGFARLVTEGPSYDHLRSSPWFDDYLRGGLYPFMLEPGTGLPQFRAILDTIVSRDLPAHDPGLSHEDLLNIRRLLAFVGRSPVDGINHSSIAANIGVTRYRVERYVRLLERAFILRCAYPAGTNLLREPKILMEPPYRLLYGNYEDRIGALREDFFALAMAQHGLPFSYAKTGRGQKTPDFVIELGERSLVLEIGGKGKGRSQFKGLDYDAKIVLAHGSDIAPIPGERVPLHCLGFAPSADG